MDKSPSKPSQRIRPEPTNPASSLNANGKPYWYPGQSKQLGRPKNDSIRTNRTTLKPMIIAHLRIKRTTFARPLKMKVAHYQMHTSLDTAASQKLL